VKLFPVKMMVLGDARGEILSSDEPLSLLGGVDPKTGAIVEREHPLSGQRVAGVILGLPHSKGSTVGSYVLYSLSTRGNAPSAIIMKKADMIVATGCVLGRIPMATVDERAWKELRKSSFGELISKSSTLALSE